MGRRHYRKKRPTIKTFRINQQILVPQVKLIDEKGELQGIVDTKEALQKAEQQGLDLIEVSPKTKPPVVKILDYGKFKYELEKKKLKGKASKKSETKGIRLTLNMAAHDLKTKQKQTEKFLGQGAKIKLEMFLRGRQRIHGRRAFEQIEKFTKNLGETVTVVQPPKKKGQRITAILQPKSK